MDPNYQQRRIEALQKNWELFLKELHCQPQEPETSEWGNDVVCTEATVHDLIKTAVIIF